MIIIDEEHENSFKQYNSNPRYNARDSAIYLSKLNNSKVILGSATPSIESSFNAKNNKYGYVKLKERFGNIEMPNIGGIQLEMFKSSDGVMNASNSSSKLVKNPLFSTNSDHKSIPSDNKTMAVINVIKSTLFSMFRLG